MRALRNDPSPVALSKSKWTRNAHQATRSGSLGGKGEWRREQKTRLRWGTSGRRLNQPAATAAPPVGTIPGKQLLGAAGSRPRSSTCRLPRGSRGGHRAQSSSSARTKRRRKCTGPCLGSAGRRRPPSRSQNSRARNGSRSAAGRRCLCQSRRSGSKQVRARAASVPLLALLVDQLVGIRLESKCSSGHEIWQRGRRMAPSAGERSGVR